MKQVSPKKRAKIAKSTITFRLPTPLLEAVRVNAARNQTSVSEQISRWLEKGQFWAAFETETIAVREGSMTEIDALRERLNRLVA